MSGIGAVGPLEAPGRVAVDGAVSAGEGLAGPALGCRGRRAGRVEVKAGEVGKQDTAPGPAGIPQVERLG